MTCSLETVTNYPDAIRFTYTWSPGTGVQSTLRVSRASPAPPYLKRGLNAKPPSPPTLPLKPSYSQIVKTKIPPCDPEKWARDPGKVTRDSSCDPLPTSAPCDQSHDLTRSRAYTRPRDPTRFGRATQP